MKGRKARARGRTDERDGLVDGVDLLGLSLDNVDGSLLVSGDESSGLDQRPSLKGSDSDGGKERSVEEVVVRRDDGLWGIVRSREGDQRAVRRPV